MAASAPSLVRAGLAVEAEGLGDASDVVGEQLQRRGEVVLRNHDVLAARDRGDPQIVIVVEPFATQIAGYRTRYRAVVNDAVVAGTEGTTQCRLCTEAELLAQVEAAISKVVGVLQAGTADEPVGPRVGGDATAGTAAPTKPSLGSLGKAGVGVAVGGAAVLGAGIGLVAHRPAGQDKPAPTRISGIALSSVAVAAVIVGLSLIAVDVRRAAHPRRTTALPYGGPGQLGVAVVHRF